MTGCPARERLLGEHNQRGWGALERAGAKLDKHTPMFDPEKIDVEAFVTQDPIYSGPDDDWIPPGQTRSARWARLKGTKLEAGRLQGRTWREAHPKNYLDFLCDPSGTVRRAYRERDGGKTALKQLDWQAVVAPAEHACMLRSLLEDLADMTGTSFSWLSKANLHPITARKKTGVLRNID